MTLFRILSTKKKRELQILEAIEENVRSAQKQIVFDVFLFNTMGADYQKHIHVTKRVITAFEEKRKLPKYFVTDPLNTGYGTNEAHALKKLERTNTHILYTPLRKLPDNNLLYSGLWRLFLQWLPISGKNWLPFPGYQDKKVTIRAYLMAANAKANHRKLMVCDDRVIITSSNLHDSNSDYANTGLEIRDEGLAQHCIRSEEAIAALAGEPFRLSSSPLPETKAPSNAVRITPLFGTDIKKSILQDIDALGEGNSLHIAMLFFSDLACMKAVKRALQRKVTVSIVADNNKASFDQETSRFPNAYLLPELQKAGADVRWFCSGKDEFHSKLLFLKRRDKTIVHVGSANLTRRSLLGTNLENNVRLETSEDIACTRDIASYLERIESDEFSLPARGKPKWYFLGNWWSRLAEVTGFATW